MPDDQNPLVVLQGRYQPDSYWPTDYLAGAVMLLDYLALLARPITNEDRSTSLRVLDGLYDTGLDVTDVFPFGAVWAFRCTGLIAARADLDADLARWRQWEESEHLGEPMPFLPELPS